MKRPDHAHHHVRVERIPPRCECHVWHWRAFCRHCGWGAGGPTQHVAFIAALRHAEGALR